MLGGLEQDTLDVEEAQASRHDEGPTFKLLNIIVMWCLRGFRAVLNLSPTIPRDFSPSDSCTPDHCTCKCSRREKTF